MSEQPPVRQWRCVLCGYVHAGSEPPGCCPVCGTGPEDFEAYAVPAADDASCLAPARWRCLLCNYVHEGAEPPDPCPVCGAEPECFQAIQAAAPAMTPSLVACAPAGAEAAAPHAPAETEPSEAAPSMAFVAAVAATVNIFVGPHCPFLFDISNHAGSDISKH